ncbi:ubiquitin C-terminal hydrolase, putative [Talaromyces stipitatus ATCC 10500]|uniref:ubiquitinyl hydrolase 1 n=1 Tax=Talaromyces stipitatus (strain ATCC 10500 / CBS 375.48 / QM 6759 / NRRL 1006) TaxID=441959 RepID=B8LYH3_TALSN|nr:ubiquitin C-terminal hydrolase, putative [Talaromyces stipitatus ATCC 10500]EED22902.1 ubiquitin C-terminal hydrolase, putative [Talaromyces stipitatus ATCC 10500]
MSYHGFTLDSSIFAGFTQYDFKSQDPQSIVALVGTSIFFLYCVFPYMGSLPFTIAHHLWNVLVYAIPSRIVAALDAENKETSVFRASSTYSTFYEKEQAMRRIVGFEKGSLDSILPRGRRLSSLGNSWLGSRDLVPPGLGNWDNSCYQNSVIQGLASLRSFANYLDRNILKLDTRGRLSTHHALKDIIERLNDPGNHGQKLWIPSELKSMSSWQQQDAQEYFSKIADQLDREVREASKMITTNAGLRISNHGEHIMGISNPEHEKLVDGGVEQPNVMHNPLEGLLAQRVGCIRCGWTEGLSLIPFNCLTVSLGKNREYDIRACLDDYMALETIEGVECAKCTLLRMRDQLNHLLKQIEEDDNIVQGAQAATVASSLKSSAQSRLQAVQEALDEEDFTEKALSKKFTKSRQAVIARAPKNLVIHVNRSVFDEETGALRKNHADVRFPRSLDLGEWCLGTRDVMKETDSPEVWNTDSQTSMLPNAGEVSPRKYELQAVLAHYGRHENGHYICFRKFSTQDFPTVSEDMETEKQAKHHWFRLSDEDVRLVSEQTVFDQGGVFMLFYECVDEPQSSWNDVSGELSENNLVMRNEQTSKPYPGPEKQPDTSAFVKIRTSSPGSDTSDISMDSEFSSARLTQSSSDTSNPILELDDVKQRLPCVHMIAA